MRTLNNTQEDVETREDLMEIGEDVGTHKDLAETLADMNHLGNQRPMITIEKCDARRRTKRKKQSESQQVTFEWSCHLNKSNDLIVAPLKATKEDALCQARVSSELYYRNFVMIDQQQSTE